LVAIATEVRSSCGDDLWGTSAPRWSIDQQHVDVRALIVLTSSHRPEDAQLATPPRPSDTAPRDAPPAGPGQPCCSGTATTATSQTCSTRARATCARLIPAAGASRTPSTSSFPARRTVASLPSDLRERLVRASSMQVLGEPWGPEPRALPPAPGGCLVTRVRAPPYDSVGYACVSY
jgi:hypothetical protein